MSHARPVLAVFVLALTAAIGNCPNSAFGTISFTGDTVVSSSQFIVGNQSFGTFRIDGGSTYTTSSSSVIIGFQQGAFGIATVSGAGSQWTFSNTSGVDVGNSGVGRLEILGGAVVTFGNSCCGGIDVANSNASQGTVVVDGPGSLLNTGGVNLGNSPTSGGSAVLQINNGGTVNTGQMTIWTGARVELDGGFLRTNQLTQNNGAIIGAGEIQLALTSTLTNNGRLEQRGGELRITGVMGMVQNAGAIAAEGGTLEFNRAITNTTQGENAGEITLRNGVVRTGLLTTSGPQLTNSGILAAIGGTNDFYGRVSNTTTGRIAVTNHSVLIFHDDVSADGVITVFPGSSAVFLEDLTMNPGSMLLADLAGTNQNTGFGDVEVVGTAQLAGAVSASLSGGYSPQAGDSFQLVAGSSLAGSLALGDMPALASGLMWDLDFEPNLVVLSVVPGLAGDYNRNGRVDNADYVVWRRTLGETGNDLAADGNSNGVVDDADYNFWRGRFGNSIGSGAAQGAPVPEPASALVFSAVFGLVARRARKG
jgi:fibronectin-binding autotransporter adhesin